MDSLVKGTASKNRERVREKERGGEGEREGMCTLLLINGFSVLDDQAELHSTLATFGKIDGAIKGCVNLSVCASPLINACQLTTHPMPESTHPLHLHAMLHPHPLESQMKVRMLRDNLNVCKSQLRCKRDELKRLWLEDVKYKKMLKLIDSMLSGYCH